MPHSIFKGFLRLCGTGSDSLAEHAVFFAWLCQSRHPRRATQFAATACFPASFRLFPVIPGFPPPLKDPVSNNSGSFGADFRPSSFSLEFGPRIECGGKAPSALAEIAMLFQIIDPLPSVLKIHERRKIILL